MKLKTILLLIEGGGFGCATGALGGSLSSHDTKLRPQPGSFDDVESWDGVTEGKGWFMYREANNWDSKRSGASVYITEGEPHKYWIKVKTHGLKKPTDTHESYKTRVKKHSSKVSRTWVTEARKIYNNPDINEVGNEIKVTWKEAFRRALEHPNVKGNISEWGEESKKKDRQPAIDGVNFSLIAESMKQSYSAIVLDNDSHEKLITEIDIPSGWSVIAHHMTIQFPGIPEEAKSDLGKTVILTATELGISDKAIAVKVSGYPSKNKTPHVTIAINKTNGGQAKHSNDIANRCKSRRIYSSSRKESRCSNVCGCIC